MNNPSQPTRHPGERLLAFLEDSLPPQERAAVMDHLAACPECSGELEALRRITSHLATDKSLFCPESWELFEFAEKGTDRDGRITGHRANARCAETIWSRFGYPPPRLRCRTLSARPLECVNPIR